jgi:hypothetical protein
MAAGFWVLGVSGLWFVVCGFGLWSLVFRFWFLVSGFWFLVSGCTILLSKLDYTFNDSTYKLFLTFNSWIVEFLVSDNCLLFFII